MKSILPSFAPILMCMLAIMLSPRYRLVTDRRHTEKAHNYVCGVAGSQQLAQDSENRGNTNNGQPDEANGSVSNGHEDQAYTQPGRANATRQYRNLTEELYRGSGYQGAAAQNRAVDGGSNSSPGNAGTIDTGQP